MRSVYAATVVADAGVLTPTKSIRTLLMVLTKRYRVRLSRNLAIALLLSLCALWGSALSAIAADCPQGAVSMQG